MIERLAKMLGVSAGGLIMFNEIKGLIVAGPILYSMWRNGEDVTQWLVAISVVTGVAISCTIVPVFFTIKGNLNRKEKSNDS